MMGLLFFSVPRGAHDALDLRFLKFWSEGPARAIFF